MKIALKIFLWTLVVVLLFVGSLFSYVQLTWDRTFDAPYPEISAVNDSVVIARGKHLVFGPSHCATCHVPMDKVRDVENGLEMPLSGGWELEFPGFGTFRAPNLTPDPETGIGKHTDAEIARAVRHMVNKNGKLIFPFMSYQGMSDEDLTAVVSFLKSQPAVKHEVKPTEYGFIGKALVAFNQLKPEGPKSPPPVSIQADSSIAYGKYIAYHLGNCWGCHTEMDPNTGKYIGKDFAGKAFFPADQWTEGYSFLTPNLTPDPATGIMANWSEESFISRFNAGRIHRGSPMPWGAYTRLDTLELKALYRFFQSLDPVENKIEKWVFAPGDPLPGN